MSDWAVYCDNPRRGGSGPPRRDRSWCARLQTPSHPKLNRYRLRGNFFAEYDESRFFFSRLNSVRKKLRF